ncbi:hypothetical protein [Rugosimonospora africana]|uniref:Uncharacterized protein n=1 Tax=Rugosimonospora africana TaxID=556532 RepID=A0A8J3QP70_9ACTN|nr:hypothetical protein [Rugosimonospora africana]GIH12636.1 hypothetical protein Raf01_08080 [Rugosimonospora africana]
MTLEQDLYSLPPERFIAARDEAVAQARADGDRALAARIGALRRPTVAAWLVNLVALHRPEQVGELLDLGTQLREAQHQLSGERMRELSSRRREAIAGLVAQARRLATDAGRGPRDPLPLAEVEATLAAAIADENVADAVRAGRLTKATGYAGFGEPLRPELRVVEGGAGRTRPAGRDRRGAPAEEARRSGRAGDAGRPPAERAGTGRTPTGRAATERPATEQQAGTKRRGQREAVDATGRREQGAVQRQREEAAQRQREREEAAQRQREREEARAARTARIEAAEAALRDAIAAERDAARALDEISTELDRLRQAQVAAQTALREARLTRRAAERDAHRAGR